MFRQSRLPSSGRCLPCHHDNRLHGGAKRTIATKTRESFGDRVHDPVHSDAVLPNRVAYGASLDLAECEQTRG